MPLESTIRISSARSNSVHTAVHDPSKRNGVRRGPELTQLHHLPDLDPQALMKVHDIVNVRNVLYLTDDVSKY